MRFFLLLCFTLVLAGCTLVAPPPAPVGINETWVQTTQQSPAAWIKGTDRWFLTGQPNQTELADREAGNRITQMPVSTFNTIQVRGFFQTQIIATDVPTVYILGPLAALRAIAVHVMGNTLYLRQVRPVSPTLMSQVIVRVGAPALQKLTQCGPGLIEARLTNTPLDVVSLGRGNMYLAGKVNLQHVLLGNWGCITAVGVNTHYLDIMSDGWGTINLAGHVGLHTLTHKGQGNVNIMGVTCMHPVHIDTRCIGRINLSGQVLNPHVIARDETCVFICGVAGTKVDASAQDKAVIGMSGYSEVLMANTSQTAQFLGSYLCVRDAYLRTHDASHMNVSASHQVFAEANQDSTIYFYGPRYLITGLGSHSGAILALGMRNMCNVNAEYRPYAYTLMRLPAPHIVPRNYKDE